MATRVDSELSGNMIDLCPVGALTSKPFRYSARTWELSRRKSVSPHDSTGANLIVQVKNHKVMRVVPFENEAVNECWIADRDRFSYEALNSDERLTSPMIKQGGQWQGSGLADRLEIRGQRPEARSRTNTVPPASALWSAPTARWKSCTWPAQLVRGLGSDNIDYRLRNAQFNAFEGVRWLGTADCGIARAAARAGGGLQPAQGPPLVCAARPPSGQTRLPRCLPSTRRCRTGPCR